MVQTRRKTAAAAQDGAVKENKAEPPAPQTPTKRAKRGRPPKIRIEAKLPDAPSTSNGSELPINAGSDQSAVAKEEDLFVSCDSQESTDPIIANEADSFLEKEDEDEINYSPLKRNPAPGRAKASPVPPPPPLTRRKSSSRIKAKEEAVQPTETAVLEEPQPLSPPHPEDPQPSMIIPAPEAIEPSENPESTDQESEECSSSSAPVVPDESESMDIASESESDGEQQNNSDNILDVPLPQSPPQGKNSQEAIRVEVLQNTPNQPPSGSLLWNRNEDKSASSPLISPTVARPRIHFLHPAYSSFAGESSQVSPQPPPPPPTASDATPSREKADNSFSMSFKPMAFKKIGLKTNPLLNSSALEESSSEIPPPEKLEEPKPSEPSAEVLPSSPPRRSSNFGTATSNVLPPPQMVELPKLSFFNMPSATPSTASLFTNEEDSPPEEQKSPEKSSTSTVSSTLVPNKISDAEIQAVKAKAEKVAQDIARRRTDEKYKEDRDDYDRRRDDRDRRYRKTDSDRSDPPPPRPRQREDDERRAREREREVTKRHDREREEERLAKLREEERRKKEEEERRLKDVEEKRIKEEELKKEEEKRIKEAERKVPEYELLAECKYLTRNAGKKKTESLVCECSQNGGNCSDNTCVNRAMLTECPSFCPAKCKNQRFAKKRYASVEPFHTGTPKGCGLRALKDIKKGKFIIEYVGEVVERDDYEKRKLKYAADKKHKHHYLCDTGIYTIDATVYGNPSRFVNHSCDPNAICEKWSVPKTPGDVSRIGFFAKRLIKAGEEITFDYQFVNYGRDAQQCFCGAATCNGWIGQKPEEFSSEDEDEDIVTTRHINMDEEEEEKLEDLNDLTPLERIDLINEMLDDLVIRNKKHARKVITIAARMTDHGQREDLLKEIFSTDTSLGTQSYYAREGMATLMGEWLAADDYSLANLKLVQVTLQTLHGDVFVSCAKSDRFLLDVLSRWLNASLDESVDIHVVADALVTCVAEPNKNYEEVEEATHKEIISNFTRVKEMAFRLNRHWFNRSVSFKIPKKVRDTKESESKQTVSSTSSSQMNESSYRDGAVSPPYQRHHHYSNSYYGRDSHSATPRFFNNGNDVHQYRFTGYHGNNYRADFPYRTSSYKDSYRERRRFGGRRSRSRSRSVSPQAHKRRKYDDRDNHRNYSPDRRSKSPKSSESGERVHVKGEPEESAPSKVSTKAEVAAATPTTSNAYPTPVHPLQYPMPGYEAYGLFDPASGMYMYHPGAPPGYYPPVAYPHPMHMMSMETLPTNDRLSELYEKATLDQLTDRLERVQQDVENLRLQVERKRAENATIEMARRRAEEEIRRQEALCRPQYMWAKARAKTGEVYYYNKVTKETQWSPPTIEQGLLDPNDYTSPDTTAVVEEQQQVEEQIPQQEQNVAEEPEAEAIKKEIVDEEIPPADLEPQPRPQSPVGNDVSEKPSSSSPSKSHDRVRDRREGSRHRDSQRSHHSNHHYRDGHRESSSEHRIRDFKQNLERCIRHVVRSHSRIRDMRDATSDKITWLIKLIVKEMYKRESSQSGFDHRFSENTDKKVKNYTKSLIDRKLDSNDLWKGYSIPSSGR